MKRRIKSLLLFSTAFVIFSCLFFPITAQSSYAARDWGGSMWKIDGKRSYVGEKSGSWKIGIRAKADGSAGDTISMGTSKTVSNSISATYGISKRILNATFKFDVSRQWSVNASKTYGLTGKKKGTWWAIQYKPVYKKYRVKTRLHTYINGKWHRTSNTKYIYARKFDHFAYRLVKSKAPK